MLSDILYKEPPNDRYTLTTITVSKTKNKKSTQYRKSKTIQKKEKKKWSKGFLELGHLIGSLCTY